MLRAVQSDKGSIAKDTISSSPAKENVQAMRKVLAGLTETEIQSLRSVIPSDLEPRGVSKVPRPNNSMQAVLSRFRALLRGHLVSAHALATFGSKKKADHWMNRSNPLFQGKSPAEVLESDPARVEAELMRIDHGVYV
jgi:uncharacterized protein (DUF2384 family)